MAGGEVLTSYMVTCLTENLRIVTDYRTTVPTSCPNNSGHTIDPDQTTVYDTRTMNNVSVLIPSGYYQCTTVDLDMPTCTPGTIFTKDISWPMRVLLWTTSFYLPENSAGDVFDVIAAPDTPIGYLIAQASADSTTISVSPTVIQNMIPGLDITLYDGVNRNDLGRIVSCDAENSTVTFEDATINSFNIGTIVLFNLKNVRQFDVCRDIATEVHLAAGWVKYKEIPPNTTLRMVYYNNNGGTKCIAMKVEYYIVQPIGLIYD